MIQVLGFPLSCATALLNQDGYAVQTRLIRCRKDTDEGAMRVVKQSMLDEKTVLLLYAAFRLSPRDQ